MTGRAARIATAPVVIDGPHRPQRSAFARIASALVLTVVGVIAAAGALHVALSVLNQWSL